MATAPDPHPHPLAPVTASDHVLGAATAAVTLVMYGDYECPYTRMARLAIRRAQEQLGDQLRYVFRNFPLGHEHPHAQHAAEAAEAASAQGRFWEMYERLFARQTALEDADLVRNAQAIGLDVERFRRELSEHVHADRVREDVETGRRSGVFGTPTIFINGVHHWGLYKADELLPAIEQATRGTGVPKAGT